VSAGLAAFSVYFKSISPMFVFRSAIGMRLTRISIRVRSPCAWSIYCARSFLARSVTVQKTIRKVPDAILKPRNILTLKLQVVYQSLFLTQRDTHCRLLDRTSGRESSCWTARLRRSYLWRSRKALYINRAG
jgi:hypothetical protein